MITLEDKIEIRARPEQIFEWFAHLDENYRDWHPEDHMECRYLKGRLLEEDSFIYFEENIGKHLEKLKLKCRVTRVEPNRCIDYKMVNFPYRLIGVGGAFLFKPHEVGSLFTAHVYIGHKIPLFGWMFDKFIQKFGGALLKAVKQHMAEEGQNLKRLLEPGRSRYEL